MRTKTKKQASRNGSPERRDKKSAKAAVAIRAELADAIEQLNGQPNDLTKRKATKEEVKEAAGYSRDEIRALVDMYYTLQKGRVSASNKESAQQRKVDKASEPGLLIHLKLEFKRLEQEALRGMEEYAGAHLLGRWAMSQHAVGPIVTAGLLAHIDLTIAQTAGAVWRFAGLDPTVERKKGHKRPYNARLKRLCWNIGECFKRSSNHPDCFYGHLYRERKKQEVEFNSKGKFAALARARLDKANKGGWRISPEQRETWGNGLVQDAGLDLRAMRYAVKMFLSHYHQVGREILGLPVAKPWVLEHVPGHIHYIPPPNWPMEE